MSFIVAVFLTDEIFLKLEDSVVVLVDETAVFVSSLLLRTLNNKLLDVEPTDWLFIGVVMSGRW